jgi:hypothetical protein
MNNHERLAFQGQLIAAKGTLENLCREDERQHRIVKTAGDLMNAVGDEMGKLSREFYDAQTLWLRLAHNHSQLIERIVKLRASIDAIEKQLQ